MLGRLGWLFSIVLCAVLVAGTGSSSSTGARPGSAQEGCTCHGTATAGVTVDLVAPAQYSAGETYNLTLKIVGAAAPLPVVGANMGGLAVKASAGELILLDSARTKLLEDGMLTHTEAGNDQREWGFRWKAPANASGNVTFSFAGNGVNGNRMADGDQWNKGTRQIAPAPVVAANSSTPASTPGGEGPGPEGLAVAGTLLAALVIQRAVARRRARRGR